MRVSRARVLPKSRRRRANFQNVPTTLFSNCTGFNSTYVSKFCEGCRIWTSRPMKACLSAFYNIFHPLQKLEMSLWPQSTHLAMACVTNQLPGTKSLLKTRPRPQSNSVDWVKLKSQSKSNYEAVEQSTSRIVGLFSTKPIWVVVCFSDAWLTSRKRVTHHTNEWLKHRVYV